MAFQIKTLAGTVVSDSTIGTVVWTDPNNAKTSDNAYATATFTEGGESEYLLATNWGFTIPILSRITGINVLVERTKIGTGSIKDNSVRLMYNGLVKPSERAKPDDWTDKDATATYGAPMDNWYDTASPTTLNHSLFGVGISVSAVGDVVAGIDSISIQVYYELIDNVKYPGTMESIAGVNVEWTDPTNVGVMDSTYATAAINNQSTNLLRCTNFNLNVPDVAAITGLTVIIGGKDTGTVPISGTQLVYDGSAIGTANNANDGLGANDDLLTRGHDSNIVNQYWQYELTPAIVNSSTFGVQFYAQTTGDNTIYIDFVVMRISYLFGGHHGR